MAMNKNYTRKMKTIKTPKSIHAMISRAITKRAEKKDYINQQLATVTSTAGAVINLSNTIVQGDNYNNRSGNSIRIIRQKFLIAVNAVTTSSTNRFILVRDLENLGTTPAATEILDAASYMAGYNSLYTKQQHRFVILKDWVTNNNINGETRTSMSYESTLPSNIFYNGPTAVAASNGKGAVFLLAIGSSATATFDFSWQVDYTDS